MPRRIVKNPIATSKIVEDGVIKYIYHNTIVVSFNPQTMTAVLNSGGYKTATTKHRMNQFAIEHNLNFGVKQKNYDWFVVFYKNGKWSEEIPFEDYMLFPVESRG
jgi:hypothetical protein